MSKPLPPTVAQAGVPLKAVPADAPVFRPPDEPGDLGKLAGYRVLKLLGCGGMGAVYLGVDEGLRRQVALKVMLPKYAADAASSERFRREARAAAAVRHDNVVTVYQVGEDCGVPFIAMEFLSGYPLDEYLKRKGRLTVPQTLRVGAETAAGLAAAHKLGLIHRDIKPANLWLEAPQGRIKILDFGLAKPVAHGEEAELTVVGVVMGTPAYMAPEQAKSEPVDHRADLFSLGVVLYQLTTGQKPFDRGSPMANLIALTGEEPVPVRALNSAVPEALERVIHALLAKAATDRPRSAAEVAKRLRALERGEPTPDPRDLSTVPAAAPQVVYVPIQVTAYEPGENAFAHLGDDPTDSPAASSTATPKPAPARPARPRPRFPLWAGGAVLLAVGVVAAVVYFATRKPAEVAKAPPPEPAVKPAVVKPFAPKVVDTPDRRLAVWLIEKRGSVNVVNGPQGAARVADLPAGAFVVGTAYLPNEPHYAITDTDLDRFRDTGVIWFALGYRHAFTDSGFDKFTQFPGAERIKMLSLSSQHVTHKGYAHLARLKSLEGLHLEYSAVTDDGLAVCRQLPELNHVCLTGTEVTDAGVEHLAGSKLTYLGLNVKTVGDTGLETLSSIDTLEKLELYRSKVTNAGTEHLAALKNLRELYLGNTAVNDAAVEHLAACKALTHLDLRGSGVTTAGGKRLMAALPGCAVLFDYKPEEDADRKFVAWVVSKGGWVAIDGGGQARPTPEQLPTGSFRLSLVYLPGTAANKFTDADIQRLSGTTARTLNIPGSEVSDTGLKALAALPEGRRMKYLELSNSQLTSAGLEHLAKFTALESLALSGADIAAGLEHLAGLPLVTLQLRRTGVTDAELAKLAAVKTLTTLDVRNTKVTAPGVAALRAALPKCKVVSDFDKP